MKHYCVVSHTHWDREWYLTYEQFRIRLVDMLDNLLAVLAAEKEYVFHLDAQTVVLEDYWEIKPEKKDLCCQFIREGRLIIGPWYVQNDFMLVSGEATVRNLLLGKKQALEAGGCAAVGYTPDQFGLISQLPQILQGFGIDNCVFGRGYRDYYIDGNGELQQNLLPSELIWRSPDGSQVLGVCMSFWYNNAQRFSADIERAVRLVKWQDEHFKGIAQTPYLLLMNGVDHLQAQADLLPILRSVQKELAPDERIYQTTLAEYLRQIRQYIPEEKLRIWEGEMVTGQDPQVLKDCSSSRIYLKIANTQLQNALESVVEPLYSLLEMAGMDGSYPAGHMDYLWKMLIRNHAHDSICGCSKDAVHRHVEDRFTAIAEAASDLQMKGIEQLSAHISRDTLSEDDYIITVFNPLEQMRTECIEVTVDILSTDQPSGLRIYDDNNVVVPFTLISHSRVNRRMISPLNLPGFREVERYQIRMIADRIPAFGYKTYRVATSEPMPNVRNARWSTVLENAKLRVEIQEKGQIDLLHKDTGHWYRDVLRLEDRADIGHSYVSIKAPGDLPRLLCQEPEIRWETDDPQRQCVILTYTWDLPAYYDHASDCRSQQTVAMPISIRLTLDDCSEVLDVDIHVDNRTKDHRLLALIRTGIASDITKALSPYDLVCHNKTDIDTRICNETRHNTGMVTICGDGKGMSIFNRGLYGYENLQREKGTLSLTLVRSTARIWPQDSTGAPEDDSWDAPENQCLRPLHLKLALYPHGENLQQANILFAQRAWQNPMVVHSGPVDTRKFLGGRPALQDSTIDENFYLPDPYPQVRLPRALGAYHLHGEMIQVTAWKKTFDRSAYLLRFFSGSNLPQEVTLELDGILAKTVYLSDLQEKTRISLPILEGKVKLRVGARQIVTLILEV